ncbi:hypothetical protein [Treponema sp.]|uniref:hypothetical protein n=1 Tax=Treponema sp. TaxID=166 RepID=UPI00388D6CDF
MKQKIFFVILTILFLSPMLIFSEDLQEIDFFPRRFPPDRPGRQESMNYNGRKMPRQGGNFAVIGVKVDEAGDYFILSVFFNDAVDTNSIHSQRIFINDEPLPFQTEFLFNKTRHMTQFFIKKCPENFSIKITDVFSFDRRPLKTTEIQNLESKSFFKYSPVEKKWQKNCENQEY